MSPDAPTLPDILAPSGVVHYREISKGDVLSGEERGIGAESAKLPPCSILLIGEV